MTDELLGTPAAPAQSAKRQAAIVLASCCSRACSSAWPPIGSGSRATGAGAPGAADPAVPSPMARVADPAVRPGCFRGGMPPAMSPEFAAERRREVVQRLTRELDLTATQQQAIDSIMAGNEAEFQPLEQEMRPRMKAFLERTRGQIDSVLTPAQREKFHQFGPPDGPPGPPPGEPGGPPPPEPGR